MLQLAYWDFEKTHSIHPAFLDQLMTIFKAHLHYNQREYEAILVASQFDEDTSKLFRSFPKNNACFSEQGVSQLKLAAELPAISRKPRSTSYNYNSTRSRSYLFRGRASYRNFGYNSRGGRGGRTDVFHSLTTNYPPSQPHYGGDDA